jgi:plastocyanin
LSVTNSGSSAYLFNNQYSGNNPTIYAISGTTIAFNLAVTGHPFLIKTASGAANYDTGLIHVATDGTVTTGSSAQGKVTGTLYWQVPANISGAYAYQCSIHSGMLGVITIKDISAI